MEIRIYSIHFAITTSYFVRLFASQALIQLLMFHNDNDNEDGKQNLNDTLRKKDPNKAGKKLFHTTSIEDEWPIFFCFSYKVIFHHHHTWKPYWKIEKEWTGRKKTSEDQDSEKFQIAKEILWKLTFKHTRCMELFANWNSFFFLVSGIFFCMFLFFHSLCVCLYCAFSHELNRIVLNLTG